MNHKMVKTISCGVLPLMTFAMLAGSTTGAEYYLRAEAFTKDLSDPGGLGTAAVPMWGFALDDGFEGLELEAVSAPGPRLVVPSGETTLTVRLDNNLLGMYMSVIAEDGNVYSFPKGQYSLTLPAGQTKDAIVTPSADGAYPLIDRTNDVTNAGGFSLGGMVRFLEVAP